MWAGVGVRGAGAGAVDAGAEEEPDAGFGSLGLRRKRYAE